MQKQSMIKTLKNKRGEAYLDTAFKILIAVVVGALIFSAIYTLFDQTILTRLSAQVNDIFSTGTSLVDSTVSNMNVNAVTDTALVYSLNC